ncbi:aspartate--tRNA ligase [Candidatus Parcubacteria bacterium]|nr:aspartate--tRNA ligase [Candidatus Parcubacteria bacterium]
MNRTLIKDLKDMVGQEVSISGWIDVRRDQGKMIFIDIRDVSGKVQSVVLPNAEAMETAKQVRPEWVVEVRGKVNERPEKNRVEGVNGGIELEVLHINVLNEAETPAIDVSGDGREINDEHRLEHRYLDLRRPRMQKNIQMRHKVAKFIRDFLDRENFLEIETPFLTKSTPEGARDYIVPARLYPGNFYALPQSPQQYKQLLMASGMERYFQIVRCMRDEDTRGDRQPEFTQLDLEMSFVTQEDVMALNERLLIEIVTKLYPEKRIQQTPFPRITYKEAVEKYGSDRPDVREDKNDPNLLAFAWVIDFPFFEKAEGERSEWTFTHNPFSSAIPAHTEGLKNKEKIGEIVTAQYDIVLNGYEIGGGSIRNHNPELLKSVFEILGYSAEEIESNFGHMLKALASGAPPHGGIAWGFDRLMMLLQGEANIREVIAFPKTGEGKDPMMHSPSEVSDKQLRELHIEVKKPKN